LELLMFRQHAAVIGVQEASSKNTLLMILEQHRALFTKLDTTLACTMTSMEGQVDLGTPQDVSVVQELEDTWTIQAAPTDGLLVLLKILQDITMLLGELEEADSVWLLVQEEHLKPAEIDRDIADIIEVIAVETHQQG